MSGALLPYTQLSKSVHIHFLTGFQRISNSACLKKGASNQVLYITYLIYDLDFKISVLPDNVLICYCRLILIKMLVFIVLLKFRF